MFSSVVHLVESISSPKSSPSKSDANIVRNQNHHHQDDDCDDTTEVTRTPNTTTGATTTTRTTNISDVSKTLLSHAVGRQQKLFRRQIGSCKNDGSICIDQQQRSFQPDDDGEEEDEADDDVDDVSEVDSINNDDGGEEDDSTVEHEEKWKALDVDSFGTVSVTVSSSSDSTSSASFESLDPHNSASDCESESDSSSVGSSSTLSSSSSSSSHMTADVEDDHEDEDFDDNETDFESFMTENEYKMSPFLLFIDSKESTPSKVSFDGSDQDDDENHNDNDDDDDTHQDGDDVYSDYEDDTEFTGTLVLSSDDDDSLLSFLNRSFSKDMMDMGLDMKSSMFLSLSSSRSFTSSSYSSSSFPGSVSSESSMPSIIKQQIQGLEHTLDELHQIIHQDDVVSTTTSPADLSDEKKEIKVDDVICEDVAAPIIMISTSGSNSSYSSRDSFGIPAPPSPAKVDNQTNDSNDCLYKDVPVAEDHDESCAGVLKTLTDYNNTIVDQQDRSNERSHNLKKQTTPVDSKYGISLDMKTGTDNLTGSETTSFKIWDANENDCLAVNTPLLTVDDILNESEDVLGESEIDENHKTPLSPMTTDPSSSRCSIKYFKQLPQQRQDKKNRSMAGNEQQLIVDDNNIRTDGLYFAGASSSSLLDEDSLFDYGGCALQVSPRSTPSNHCKTGSNNLKIIAHQDFDCTHGPNWEEIESEMESLSDVWSSLRSEGPNPKVMESRITGSFPDVWPEPHPTPVVLKSILRQKNVGQSDDTFTREPEIKTLTSETITAVEPKSTTATQVESIVNDTTRNIQWSEHVLVHLIEASGRRRRLPRPSLQNELIIQN